jgi:hypothetical protein
MSSSRRAARFGSFVIACACACACAPAPTAPPPNVPPARAGQTPAARNDAPVVPSAVVEPHGTLLLGDLHGTQEIPAFVADLIATPVADQPVVLGLEIRRDRAPSIEAFLASDGGPAARDAVLRDRG